VYTAPHAGGPGGDAGLRSEQTYAVLKRRLLQGEFPLNARLGEERLAALVGVSRTPVREALMRLHAEGFVRRGADGGYVPVAPDVTLMRHLYEVRIGLEIQALHRPARHGTRHDPAVLEALRDEWRALLDDGAGTGGGDGIDGADGTGTGGGGATAEPNPGFVLLDEAFHITLAEAAGNPVLADQLRLVSERIRIVRMQDFLDPGRIEATVAEHLGLVEAVLVGDLNEAEERFTVHVGRSMAVVEERVAVAIARMAATPHPEQERGPR
jgi:DNA-binding GntR family transcriptional regulator